MVDGVHSTDRETEVQEHEVAELVIEFKPFPVLSNMHWFSCLWELEPRVLQVWGPYPLEAACWVFSSVCLGKEDCIMNAGENVIALDTPIFKDTSMADVIVYLGWKEAGEVSWREALVKIGRLTLQYQF